MGGRGSGGGRSGGGGGSASTNKQPRLISANQYYQEKYSEMNDYELNRAYKNAQIAMKKENAKLQHEINKLQKINEDFAKVKETDSNYQAKVDAMNKQIERVNDARTRVKLSETAFYMAVNEKNNVRNKHTINDLSKMTNGQLNSFYSKSYRETQKAKLKADFTKNKKTREKNVAKMNFHNDNFWKANAEKDRRSLGFGQDSKNW